jgi:sRNA-binding carbon storage regulator CsrA
MLTLARRPGEAVSLVVDHPDGTRTEIAVIVSESSTGQAKLGFDAPPYVTIEREEIATPTQALKNIRAAYHRRCLG